MQTLQYLGKTFPHMYLLISPLHEVFGGGRGALCGCGKMGERMADREIHRSPSIEDGRQVFDLAFLHWRLSEPMLLISLSQWLQAGPSEAKQRLVIGSFTWHSKRDGLGRAGCEFTDGGGHKMAK